MIMLSNSITLRNEYLLKRKKDTKVEHPFWGDRRVWAYLRHVYGSIVNKKHEKVNMSRVPGIAIVFTSICLINKEKFRKW